MLSKLIYKPPCSPSADLCCSMLSLVSGCNLVASIDSLICIKLISKKWSFSGSEDRFTKSHSFIAKDLGSFGAVKKVAGTEFAGGYNVILNLICIINNNKKPALGQQSTSKKHLTSMSCRRRRRRRRRAYAPTSITASHDNHEKINS